MSYQFLNGYSASLSSKLSATDGLLPITEAKALAEKLGENHTYLVLNDGTGAEVVKAYAFGNAVKIERGKDGTDAKAFPVGSCVKWEFTQSALDEVKELKVETKNCSCCSV